MSSIEVLVRHSPKAGTANVGAVAFVEAGIVLAIEVLFDEDEWAWRYGAQKDLEKLKEFVKEKNRWDNVPDILGRFPSWWSASRQPRSRHHTGACNRDTNRLAIRPEESGTLRKACPQDLWPALSRRRREE